jgi:hypothetical protein
MFRLIKSLSPSQFHPREYILAMSDTSSLNKALDFEKSMNPSADGYHVHYIQRPREVGQSFSSSFWPLIRATMETGWLFWTLLPDAVTILNHSCLDFMQWTWNLHSYGIDQFNV